jgi:hypothetical protein
MVDAVTEALDAKQIADELARVRDTFRGLVDGMTPEALSRRTNGTRWTNRQMLFHMLFGYLLIWPLIWLAKALSLLPRGASRPLAAVFNFGARPFHVVNYLGSAGGGTFVSPQWMVRMLDRLTVRLAARRERESERSLARGMYYPTRWDPFFREFMTVADLYHYPTQHFDFHRRQLSA